MILIEPSFTMRCSLLFRYASSRSPPHTVLLIYTYLTRQSILMWFKFPLPFCARCNFIFTSCWHRRCVIGTLITSVTRVAKANVCYLPTLPVSCAWISFLAHPSWTQRTMPSPISHVIMLSSTPVNSFINTQTFWYTLGFSDTDAISYIYT